MITRDQSADANARTRSNPGRSALTLLLAPALGLVTVLFGGGLVLGFLQSLGYLPAAGMKAYSLQHFENILTDPGFLKSLGLTFYISVVSTVVAGALSISAALFLIGLRGPRRLVGFIFEIPLAVPHLVIATAAVFLLAPSGAIPTASARWASRAGNGSVRSSTASAALTIRASTGAVTMLG